MAANWRSASLGKRVVKQICTINNSSGFASASTVARRATHTSAYDKNLDDQLHSSVVPDDVIQLKSDKYWAPHPQTGVFGPATEQNSAAGKDRGLSTAPSGHNTPPEEMAWFRPTSLEDLEKPHHT